MNRTNFNALVITSSHAVKAISQVKDGIHFEGWTGKTIFVVGKSTAEILLSTLEMPQMNIIVGGSGASELANIIVENMKKDGTSELLFLCGDRRREELPQTLHKQGIIFKELVVYETHNILENNGATLFPPRWLVFFSPSSIESAVQMLPLSNHQWKYPA
jgi:uroporphyrinogen-III synthase